MNYNEEGIRSLVSAILTLAVKDTRALLSKKRQIEKDIALNKDKESLEALKREYRIVLAKIQYEKAFFYSDWCELLTDILNFSLTGKEMYEKISTQQIK